jgi:hypothetical protein
MNEDLELLFYRIFCGYLVFTYNNERYTLKSATIDIKYEAQLLYNTIINDEKYNDWLREDNLDNLLIYLNLWTKDTNMIIKDLDKKIENSKADYYSNFKFTDKKNTIKKNLDNYKKQLSTILGKKDELYSNTLEGYANSIKNEFIITHTLYKNNSLIFNNQNNTNNYMLFNNVVNELNKHSIGLSDFKKLARSHIWRSYWNVSKNSIFSQQGNNITDDQRTIIGISQMYDRVYEHPECPADEIIEDDDALDGWMIVQKRKIEKDKKQQQVDNLNPKLKNAQEVFLFANNNDEAQEIVGLNNIEGLNRMKSKIAHVNKFGLTEESQLPDVQVDLRSQLNQQMKNRK